MPVEMLEEELTEKIIGAAIRVHRYWGPGLYESIYERSLCVELDRLNISLSSPPCLCVLRGPSLS